jgi:4-alpha-glucanotransferase
MRLPRTSGVLVHPTSLPNGRLDEEAYRFVDWLAAAGQTWWSLLPLGPPDEHGSPYAARSAFAASPELLAEPRAPVGIDELESFVARHPYWIGEWAEFADGDAVAGQVRFEREWAALRAYAAGRGVRLIGDLPIYVAPGSADHRFRPELFQDGFVAGVPPDYFSATGQLWRNPLYDWPAHRAQGYRWWIERLRRTFELVDVTRVDHFRGFVAYWSVPARNRTAKSGRWRRGPGAELFRAAEAELGELRLIAENLGVITDPVEALRRELGLPGMVVLEFGFDGTPSNPHRLENHRPDDVVYTGTHDHDTARGWFESLPARARARTGLDPREPHWSLIALALSSRANLALIPVQDVLGLGSEARLNMPGRAAGNWTWRLHRGELTDEHAGRLRELTVQSARATAR